MRFVKLSPREVPDVQHFFRNEIRTRTPPGRLHVPQRTPPYVAQNGLEVGEPLVFIHEARVVFTALAASGRLPNDNNDHDATSHKTVIYDRW
jgi:hypothetical protein